jgi:hypothetical protein
MEILFLLLVVYTSLIGQDVNYETIKLKDGRTFIGRYDIETKQLHFKDLKGSITVAIGDIESRTPWTDPEKEKAERQRKNDEEIRNRRIENETIERQKMDVLKKIEDIDRSISEISSRDNELKELSEREFESKEWIRNHGIEFDPQKYSKDEMNELGNKILNERIQKIENERLAKEQEILESERQALESKRAEMKRKHEESLIAKEREIYEYNQRQEEKERIKYERIVEEEQRKLKIFYVIVLIVFLFLFLLPVVISIFRNHKYLLPIIVICIMFPIILGGAGYAASAKFINGTYVTYVSLPLGSLAWLGALLWSVMPNMGVPRIKKSVNSSRRPRHPLTSKDNQQNK